MTVISLVGGSKRPRQVEPHDDPHRQVEPPGAPLPNARTFINSAFANEVRPLLIHHGGSFFVWNESCWPEVEDAALRAQLYEFFEDATYLHVTASGEEIRPFAPNRYKVADLLDAMRAVAHVPSATTTPSWLDAPGAHPADEYVACQNGLVHVPSRSLHPATPGFFVHHAVPFAYDRDAPAPERWLTFIEQLWPDDQQARDTLQEVFGYLVSGDTRLQKIVLLVGPKRGGKGTLARIAKALIGEHHVAGPTLAGLATNFGLAPLIGKPVAIVSDARIRSGGTDIVTERLLSISGEDTLTIDRKNRDPWTGQLPTRFVVLSNELPRLTDSSGALASRFLVLTLTNSFYGRENPDLTAELTAELPGIFNWALDGLERLQARGRFETPRSSTDAIRELEDLGSPMGAFVRDVCETGPGHSVNCDVLYQAWRAWCEDHGRDRPGTTQTFGRDLRAVLPGLRVTRPRDDDGNQSRHYEGVGIRPTDRIGVGRDSARLSTSTPTVRRDETRHTPSPIQQETLPAHGLVLCPICHELSVLPGEICQPCEEAGAA